jgi:hypothetical protein
MADERPQNKPSVAVRMSPDVVILGRSLARSLYGSEDKLGQFLEMATQFYAAHQEDEVRAAAILKTTEDILLRRIQDRFASMFKDLTNREDKMVERIAGLIAISSYESCLSELMLKDLYGASTNHARKERYEELRGTAAKRMKNRMEKVGAEQIAELQQEVISLRSQLEQEQTARIPIEQKQAAAEENLAEINRLKQELTEQNRQLKRDIDNKQRLLSWYTRRDIEVPQIQERNKRTFGKQNWEDAAKLFENDYPKPVI